MIFNLLIFVSGQLDQDFRVHFARIFNVEIIYWPESIKLEVCYVNLH